MGKRCTSETLGFQKPGPTYARCWPGILLTWFALHSHDARVLISTSSTRLLKLICRYVLLHELGNDCAEKLASAIPRRTLPFQVMPG